ncbi:hypothetical protein E4K10_19345 [Streptomyces sp. T1317-0309]|nr:hypothetical protein E4K10_19345 [Streptomyces sp. T1317-0309]
MPFHEIMRAVRDARSTRDSSSTSAVHVPELRAAQARRHGRHWEDTTGLPIPLGAIIAKRSLGADTLKLLADSAVVVPCARPGTTPRRRARMSWNTRRRWTRGGGPAHRPVRQRVHGRPGEDGYAAVRGLLTRAAAEGLVPPLGPDALVFP